MKSSTKNKICSRKKTNIKMMNLHSTRNIMITKMISTMITRKWLMIFHRKKVAMHKMKKENTMPTMNLTTMTILVPEIEKSTLKTKKTISILMAILTTSKAFMMKSDKARKTGTNKFGNMMTKLTKTSNQSISRKDIWTKL